MDNNTVQSIKYSFKKSLPIMAGYVVLGIGFGILLQSKGYNALWAFFMSVIIYAGSMQYVAVDLLANGATLLLSALMTFLIHIRFLFYGLSLLEKYKNVGKIKPYLIFALTDETFSIVCTTKVPEGINKRVFYFFISFFNQLYWIFGCVTGAIIGQTINFNSAGVDFSMTALFVIIFVEQWEHSKNHFSAISGVLISLICLVIFGANHFLIPSMILITCALLIGKKRLTTTEVCDD